MNQVEETNQGMNTFRNLARIWYRFKRLYYWLVVWLYNYTHRQLFSMFSKEPVMMIRNLEPTDSSKFYYETNYFGTGAFVALYEGIWCFAEPSPTKACYREEKELQSPVWLGFLLSHFPNVPLTCQLLRHRVLLLAPRAGQQGELAPVCYSNLSYGRGDAKHLRIFLGCLRPLDNEVQLDVPQLNLP